MPDDDQLQELVDGMDCCHWYSDCCPIGGALGHGEPWEERRFERCSNCDLVQTNLANWRWFGCGLSCKMGPITSYNYSVFWIMSTRSKTWPSFIKFCRTLIRILAVMKLFRTDPIPRAGGHDSSRSRSNSDIGPRSMAVTCGDWTLPSFWNGHWTRSNSCRMNGMGRHGLLKAFEGWLWQVHHLSPDDQLAVSKMGVQSLWDVMRRLNLKNIEQSTGYGWKNDFNDFKWTTDIHHWTADARFKYGLKRCRWVELLNFDESSEWNDDFMHWWCICCVWWFLIFMKLHVRKLQVLHLDDLPLSLPRHRQAEYGSCGHWEYKAWRHGWEMAHDFCLKMPWLQGWRKCCYEQSCPGAEI